ncbi:hypothetical protein V6N11_008608 [Hibiscus sabdariffa]|uniref:Uncharacterized protein n=2 Tax=Hibiscus sabdariffa TaxID=183260 RepID=A0ABR2PP48_9ROSI
MLSLSQDSFLCFRLVFSELGKNQLFVRIKGLWLKEAHRFILFLASPILPFSSGSSSTFVQPTGALHGISNNSVSAGSPICFSSSVGSSTIAPSAPLSNLNSLQNSGSSTGQVSSSLNPNLSSEVSWFLDSGATHHITNDRSNLQSEEIYSGFTDTCYAIEREAHT